MAQKCRSLQTKKKNRNKIVNSILMLKTFDVFPKFTDKGAKVRTFSGGLITIIISIWIFFLISNEIKSFLNSHITSNIVVDKDSIFGPRKVFIDFDILIHAACPLLHIDLFEDDNSVKTDIIENIIRERLDSNRTPIEYSMEKYYKHQMLNNKTFREQQDMKKSGCGSCYAASEPGQCCNTCKDVMDAFKKKGWSYYSVDRWEQCIREGYLNFGDEKCHITGSLKVKRGSGYFHIGLGSNKLTTGKGHLHDLSGVKNGTSLNHTIYSFKVGPSLPDFKSPLDNIEVELPNSSDKDDENDDENNKNEHNFWLITYFLHLVPSTWITPKKKIESYRYSAMYSQRILPKVSSKALPSIQFYYDFSPMRVVTEKKRTSLRTFLTHVGGIIGGAFSFAAIVDALMFSALTTIEGKDRINKYA